MGYVRDYSHIGKKGGNSNLKFPSKMTAKLDYEGVQYAMKTAQYIPKFYIYTLNNYFYLKICFLAKYI